MIEQLSIFDLPPVENPPKELFNHHRHGGISFSRNVVHTKRGKAIVDGRYKIKKICPVCSKEFWSTPTGGRKKPTTCSGECRELRKIYGTIENKNNIIDQIVDLLENGTPNKKAAKILNVPYAEIIRVCEKKYGGIPPVHAKAVTLYREGKTEDEISFLMNAKRGAVTTWLMRNIDDYKPPEKQKKLKNRDLAAKYLWSYRKEKTARGVACHFNVDESEVQKFLQKSKWYKKNQKNKHQGQSVKQYVRLNYLSKKFRVEKDFQDHLEKLLTDYGFLCIREQPYLESLSLDILAIKNGQKFAIETKNETRTTRFTNGAMQAVAAAKCLNATPVLCHPSDTQYQKSAEKKIRVVFGSAIVLCNEKTILKELLRYGFNADSKTACG